MRGVAQMSLVEASPSMINLVDLGYGEGEERVNIVILVEFIYSNFKSNEGTLWTHILYNFYECVFNPFHNYT